MGMGIWHLGFKNQNSIARKRMSIIYNEFTKRVWIHVTECVECPDGECISGTISLVLDREDFKRLLETLEEVYKEVCKDGEMDCKSKGVIRDD